MWVQRANSQIMHRVGDSHLLPSSLFSLPLRVSCVVPAPISLHSGGSAGCRGWVRGRRPPPVHICSARLRSRACFLYVCVLFSTMPWGSPFPLLAHGAGWLLALLSRGFPWWEPVCGSDFSRVLFNKRSCGSDRAEAVLLCSLAPIWVTGEI